MWSQGVPELTLSAQALKDVPALHSMPVASSTTEHHHLVVLKLTKHGNNVSTQTTVIIGPDKAGNNTHKQSN